MGGIRINSKDQHIEISCERMVNKNKSTQKSEMIRCRYGLVRQREIVLFAVIQPISPTPEKKDMGKLQYLDERSSRLLEKYKSYGDIKKSKKL